MVRWITCAQLQYGALGGVSGSVTDGAAIHCKQTDPRAGEPAAGSVGRRVPGVGAGPRLQGWVWCCAMPDPGPRAGSGVC